MIRPSLFRQKTQAPFWQFCQFKGTQFGFLADFGPSLIETRGKNEDSCKNRFARDARQRRADVARRRRDWRSITHTVSPCGSSLLLCPSTLRRSVGGSSASIYAGSAQSGAIGTRRFYGSPWATVVFERSLFIGHLTQGLGVVKWLHNTGGPWDAGNCASAAEGGRCESVEMDAGAPSGHVMSSSSRRAFAT